MGFSRPAEQQDRCETCDVSPKASPIDLSSKVGCTNCSPSFSPKKNNIRLENDVLALPSPQVMSSMCKRRLRMSSNVQFGPESKRLRGVDSFRFIDSSNFGRLSMNFILTIDRKILSNSLVFWACASSCCWMHAVTNQFE